MKTFIFTVSILLINISGVYSISSNKLRSKYNKTLFEYNFSQCNVNGTTIPDDPKPEILDSTNLNIENPGYNRLVDLEDGTVFCIVDKMPTFRGGSTVKFQKYIYRKLRYPYLARVNNISGKVVVQFIVDEEGYVEDVKILESANYALDKEAIRVVESSPRWKPGEQKGKKVKVQFVFPITFMLN